MLARRPNWKEEKNRSRTALEKITAGRTVGKLSVGLVAFAVLHTGLAEARRAFASLDAVLGIIAPALVVAVAVAVAAAAAAAAVAVAVAVAAVIELVVLELAVVVEAAAVAL